jgi:hypothetical protein
VNSATEFSDTNASAIEPDQESAPGLTDDTQGRLAPEARRAVIELMRNGVVLARDKPGVYTSLVRFRGVVEGHLADMYLRMLIDEPAGIAILLQQAAEGSLEDGEDFTALTHTRVLSLYDTLLALVLRKHYQERQSAGDQQIFVDYEQIESKLTPFLPLTNSDRSDRRKLNGALERMKERKLITSVRGDDERFEITPVIRYVVNAEFLEQLLAAYRTLLDERSK